MVVAQQAEEAWSTKNIHSRLAVQAWWKSNSDKDYHPGQRKQFRHDENLITIIDYHPGQRKQFRHDENLIVIIDYHPGQSMKRCEEWDKQQEVMYNEINKKIKVVSSERQQGKMLIVSHRSKR